MATINRGLFPFLEGAFGKSRKALPEGMSEDGAIKPVAKAPSRWKNAITGGGAAEDAFDVNYRHMEREKNAGLQRELLNQRELGDNERLTTAGAQAVTLEKLRAANDLANLKAKSDETMRPYFTASMYPNGVPETADERTKMMYNYGKYGGKILGEEGQANAEQFIGMQRAKYAKSQAKDEDGIRYVNGENALEYEKLAESVRGQVLGNDKLNIDNAMPRPLKSGFNIDSKTGRRFFVEEPTYGNVATPHILTRKMAMPDGSELTSKEEVIRNSMEKMGKAEITDYEQDPNKINTIEIANEENAMAAEQRLRGMQKAAKERHNPTHDGSPQEEYKGTGKDSGPVGKAVGSTIVGLVKKFMKLL